MGVLNPTNNLGTLLGDIPDEDIHCTEKVFQGGKIHQMIPV